MFRFSWGPLMGLPVEMVPLMEPHCYMVASGDLNLLVGWETVELWGRYTALSVFRKVLCHEVRELGFGGISRVVRVLGLVIPVTLFRLHSLDSHLAGGCAGNRNFAIVRFPTWGVVSTSTASCSTVVSLLRKVRLISRGSVLQ